MRLSELPLMSLCFVSETACIGAGHEFNPIAFTKQGAGWAIAGKLQEEPKEEKKEEAVAASGASAARAMFAKMDSAKKAPASGGAKKVDTSWKSHQSAVTCIKPFGAPAGSASFPCLTSTAMDGRLVVWDLSKTAVGAVALGI